MIGKIKLEIRFISQLTPRILGSLVPAALLYGHVAPNYWKFWYHIQVQHFKCICSNSSDIVLCSNNFLFPLIWKVAAAQRAVALRGRNSLQPWWHRLGWGWDRRGPSAVYRSHGTVLPCRCLRLYFFAAHAIDPGVQYVIIDHARQTIQRFTVPRPHCDSLIRHHGTVRPALQVPA